MVDDDRSHTTLEPEVLPEADEERLRIKMIQKSSVSKTMDADQAGKEEESYAGVTVRLSRRGVEVGYSPSLKPG